MIDPRSRWFAPEQFGPALKTWASVWEDEDLYSSSSARSTGRSSLTEESFAVQAKNNFGGNENQSVAKETWEHGNDAGSNFQIRVYVYIPNLKNSKICQVLIRS